jgi:hypothetical protein
MNSTIRIIFSIIGLMAFKITVINSQMHITINGNVLIHELNNTQFDDSKNSMFLHMIMGLSTTVNMTQVTKSNRTITRNNMNITELFVVIDADVEITEVDFEDDQDSSSSSSSSSSSESHEHHYKTTIKTTTISTLWYCKIYTNDLLNCSTSNGSTVIILPTNSSNNIISNNQVYNIFDCYYTNISMLNCTLVPTSNETATTTSLIVSPLMNIHLNCSLNYNSVLVCNPSPSVLVTTSQAQSSTTTSIVISNNFTTVEPTTVGPTTDGPTTVGPTTKESTSQGDSTASLQSTSTGVAGSTPTSTSTIQTIQTTTSCQIFNGVSDVYGSTPMGSKPYTILISEIKQLILFSGSMVYSLASISNTNQVNIYGGISNIKLNDADFVRLSNSIITGVRIFSKDVIYGLQFQLYNNFNNSLSWQSFAGMHNGKYSVLDANSISSVVEIFEITSITLFIDSSLVVLSFPYISGIKFEYSYSSCELYSVPSLPTTTFFVTTTFKPPTTIKTSSSTICPLYTGQTSQFGYVGAIGKKFSVQTDALLQIVFFADDSYVYAVQFIFLNNTSVFYGDEADTDYEQDSIQIIQLGIGVQITAIKIKSSKYINSIQVQTYNSKTNTYLWSPVSKKFDLLKRDPLNNYEYSIFFVHQNFRLHFVSI